jgi:hypothetical protein
MCLHFRVRPLGETGTFQLRSGPLGGEHVLAFPRVSAWADWRCWHVLVCHRAVSRMGLHEKQGCALRVETAHEWLPRWYHHLRVYMRVQGTMANVTGGPVYKPDRESLSLARQIGLGPHVNGYRPLPGGVRRPGGAQFEDTPVRTLTQIHPDMSVQAQKAIIGLVEALWYRASPNGCVEVCPLRKGDAGIGQLTDAVMMSVDQASVLSDVHWRKDLGAVVVRGVLTRFRGHADPLGHQRGVLLEGVDHPLNLGQAALFVNPPMTWSASPDCEDHDDVVVYWYLIQ